MFTVSFASYLLVVSTTPWHEVWFWFILLVTVANLVRLLNAICVFVLVYG